MILYYSITVFLTQLIFIGCRTWNVKSIARGNMAHVLISGGFVHLSWLVSIAIGAVSMSELLTHFDWKYIPVVLCSLTGGLLGSYIGMKEKIKK